mgnify:CR=1 FL=1
MQATRQSARLKKAKDAWIVTTPMEVETETSSSQGRPQRKRSPRKEKGGDKEVPKVEVEPKKKRPRRRKRSAAKPALVYRSVVTVCKDLLDLMLLLLALFHRLRINIHSYLQDLM